MSKPNRMILAPASQNKLLDGFNVLQDRKHRGMVMLPTWFLHFPVTELFQGSWKLEQGSNSPHGFSRHADLQKNGALRTYSLFLQSSGNEHTLNCSKCCFLHFNNTNWYVLWAHFEAALGWGSDAPVTANQSHSFPSESYSCFKGWKHGVILPWEENSEFKGYQISFSF